MILCYIIIGVLIIGIGVIFGAFPQFTKNILTIIKDKDLFFIPGIIEILIALFALFYRSEARLELYITVVSLFMFIDGIFYLASSKTVKMTFEMFLDMEMKTYKLYCTIIIAIGFGYLINGI